MNDWVGGVTYVTVATRGPKRYFDLDAVRGPGSPNTHARLARGADPRPTNGKKADNPNNNYGSMNEVETVGAPPLDWHIDNPNHTPTTGTEPMGELDYLIGDVFDRLREIPDNSIDLIVTSPPFLALRSYLPADHPDKAKEIGSEATPAAFLDRLLELTAEWGRVLAPHGSLCVELGDTYANQGGQSLVPSKAFPWREAGWTDKRGENGRRLNNGEGWPLNKSLTGIPTLYPWSLAYGRNLLTGQESPAGRWRIRNVIVWARPNPPVGALGDKFRPATSYITVACRGPKRYFDLDAVRTDYAPITLKNKGNGQHTDTATGPTARGLDENYLTHAGAPPLDWHTDDHPEDGDWLWKLSTQPYRGAHYATFPLELPTRLIMAMCPLRVCQTCGKPSERIVGDAEYGDTNGDAWRTGRGGETLGLSGGKQLRTTNTAPTLGWSDCGHNRWRTGRVLDPFAGSGTTLQAAQNVGRHAIGIDLDPRNAHLAQDRVGMFLNVKESQHDVSDRPA